ncbi:MAG TPA: LysE family translocator [Accumulibacter sp.]|nr:LysE family translocator [Accumulibacter sp.]
MVGLSTFLLASVVLAVTPGPGVVYILARTASQGRRAGLCSVAGVAIGNFLNVCAASLGLTTLLTVFPMTVAGLRQAGAIYLIYIGFRAFFPTKTAADARVGTVRGWPFFREGVLVALFNPKTALFFAAFLPQFVDPALPMSVQCIVLGAIFVGIALLSDSLYVFGAGFFLRALARWRGRRFSVHSLGGLLLIALGIFFALGRLVEQSGIPARSP